MLFEGRRPKNLGVHNGHLAECPATPNAVSSDTGRKSRFIEPLRYEGSASEAMMKLRKLMLHMDRAALIDSSEEYLYFECATRVMGFVDDVEFLCKPKQNLIHMRSASRLGISDFGKNRERLEQVRELFNQN